MVFGRTDFHLLQNVRAEAARIHYYIFRSSARKDRDLTHLPLIERRVLLKSLVMKANPPRLKQRVT
jgi:ATP-dependent DNA ligase